MMPGPWRAVLRRLPLLGTVVGLGLAVWLVATNDLGAVASAFGRIGAAGLAAIVLVRMTALLLCGIAWARILYGLSPAAPAGFVILRAVREGINVLLPVASVGGEVVGGRLLTFWGVTGPLATASVLVDMLIQAGTQAVLVLTGVLLLHGIGGASAAALADWTARVLFVAALLLAAFLALQCSGAARFLQRRFGRGSGGRPSGGVVDALDAVWARGRGGRLVQSALLHLAAWMLGAVEIAIALACIGVEGVSLTEIVVIEALTQAIKAAAFVVPSGLGVQEGGFVLVAGLFGIDTGTALALSLVKRVPDVAIGLPALVVWQALEARRGGVLPR